MVTLKTVNGAKVVEISLNGGKVALPVRDARLLGLELLHITAGGETGYCNYQTEYGRGGCPSCD